MKTAIITGGNSGLGFETARLIAGNPDWRVVLACRNDDKAAAAREAIVEATGNPRVETLRLDTSSLESARAAAQEAISRFGGSIDVLVNNAGIPTKEGVTREGFGCVFATNYLGHFLLTMLLHPYLSAGARILNITSDMHNPPGGIRWPGSNAVAHPSPNDKNSYALSKLCMLYFTYEHDRVLRLVGSTVDVNAFNPGFMADTGFAGEAGRLREQVVKTTMPDRYSTLDASSRALAELATSAAFSGISGVYFDRGTREAESSELSRNAMNAIELRSMSLEWCGLGDSLI